MSLEVKKTTLEIIAERIKSGSKPNGRNDLYKVGLVLEGGGTRAVRGAGMGTGLQALGALNAFDVVDAVSGGGPTAAFGAGKQGPLGTSIYYEDMQDGFVDLRRYYKGKPVIDIPYITHDVMINKKRLDWEAVVTSPIPIHLFVTSALDAGLIDLNQFNSRDAVHDALHWTCRIPIAAGLPIKVGAKFLSDGTTVTAGIPFQQAIDQDCTHILALLTRPVGSFKPSFSPHGIIIYLHLLKNGYHKLARASLQEAVNYNRLLKRMARMAENPLSHPQVEIFQLPKTQRRISNIEIRSHILRQEAIDGFNLTMEKFAPFGLSMDSNVTIR